MARKRINDSIASSTFHTVDAGASPAKPMICGRNSEGVRDQVPASNRKRTRDIIDKATLSVRCLVTMSLDLNTILRDWPHENGNIKVRKIAGLDGREKLQLRVDLGVLQMEVAGRPDGRRPHNCESLLEYHQKRATRTAAKGEIEHGRDAITEFLQQSSFPELVSKSSEIAFLEEWLEEVKAKRPLSKLEIMQREMQTAIAKELYERAAELRDAIKLLQARKH